MREYQEALIQTGEYGVVEELRYPLVIVRGLPGATIDEIVIFNNNQQGQVTGLNKDKVEVILLSPEAPHPGAKVARTGKPIAIPVSNALRGMVIDALGQPLITKEGYTTDASEQRIIDARPLNIGYRSKIRQGFKTGTSMVDLMLPLGAGQREVVLGDKKTGKTSFLYATIKAASEKNIVIYAIIGKPWNAIADLYNFAQELPEKNFIIVASSADTTPGLIVLTPLTAMTIAEYFRDAGQDTLVILDDLTTHAHFYRELALLARRFPGRESYPGDIFHVHARLLERAGNFKHPNRTDGVAITCLPVAETVQADLTSYIVSNLISITDGHLLFDAAAFNQGRRPAIDHTLSVTRVGHQTQKKLTRKLYQEIATLLLQHERAQSYTHFGAELSKEMHDVLNSGNKIIEFFSQPLFMAIPKPVQTVLITMIWQGWLREQPDEATGQWRDRLTAQYTGSEAARTLLDTLAETETLKEFIPKLEEHKKELLDLCQTERIWRKK